MEWHSCSGRWWCHQPCKCSRTMGMWWHWEMWAWWGGQGLDLGTLEVFLNLNDACDCMGGDSESQNRPRHQPKLCPSTRDEYEDILPSDLCHSGAKAQTCKDPEGKTRLKWGAGSGRQQWFSLPSPALVLLAPYSYRRENKLRIQNGWLCHLAPEIIRQLSPDTEEDKLPFSKHSDVFALG